MPVISFPQPQKRQQTRAANSLADTIHTLADQDAVIGIKRNKVGDGAQCDQVQQMCQVRLLARQRKPVALTQCAPDHTHQVKNHANTGKCLAGELITGTIRIDDGMGGR